MTILESLKSLSAYPIPSATIANIAEGLGLFPEDETDSGVRSSANYKRAQASVYLFLAEAPNVSQGGITFNFSDEERKRFRLNAETILDGLGEGSELFGTYGYMGEDL